MDWRHIPSPEAPTAAIVFGAAHRDNCGGTLRVLAHVVLRFGADNTNVKTDLMPSPATPPGAKLPVDWVIWENTSNPTKLGKQIKFPNEWCIDKPLKEEPVLYFHFRLPADIKIPSNESDTFQVNFTPNALLYVGERKARDNLKKRVREYPWLVKHGGALIFTYFVLLERKPFGGYEDERYILKPRKTLESLVYLKLLTAYGRKYPSIFICNRGFQFDRDSMVNKLVKAKCYQTVEKIKLFFS